MQNNSDHLGVLDARLLEIWRSCKSIDNREFCIEFGRAVLTDIRQYDDVVEVLRQALNQLPRFSFLLGGGGVRGVPDGTGRWIDWQSAHELFDAEVVDGLLVKADVRAAIAKAQGGAA